MNEIGGGIAPLKASGKENSFEKIVNQAVQKRLLLIE
jgi:hypothetical protein